MPRDDTHDEHDESVRDLQTERTKRAIVKYMREQHLSTAGLRQRLIETRAALDAGEITPQQANGLLKAMRRLREEVGESAIVAEGVAEGVVEVARDFPAIVEDTDTSAAALLSGRVLTDEQRRQLKHLIAQWDQAPKGKGVRPRLTDAAVQIALQGALPCEILDARTRDGGVSGFYIRLHEDRVHGTFYVRYKSRAMRQQGDERPLLDRTVRHKLARWPQLTVAQARQKAREVLAAVELGRDPQHEHMQERNAVRDYRKRESMVDIARRWMQERQQHITPKHWDNEQLRLDKYILPTIGRLKAAEVTRDHAVAIKDAATRVGKVAANKALSCLSALMSYAGRGEAGICKGVRRHEEQKRDRHITDEELAAIGRALDRHEALGKVPPMVIKAIRLAMAMGLRISEARELEWSEVRFDQRALYLSKSKTGRSKRPLNAVALAQLAALEKRRKTGAKYVFPADPDGAKCFLKGNVDYGWTRIRATAAQEVASTKTVALHDFRHLFASTLDQEGASMAQVMRALGHASAAQSNDYITSELESARRQADRAAAKIAAVMTGKTATVTKLPTSEGQPEKESA